MMKGIVMKKIIALMLVLVSVLSAVSCSSGGKSVMSLGNAKVNEATYKYWMSTYKAMYLRSYTDIKDTEEFWMKKISDTSDITNEELVNNLIRDNIKTNLVSMALYVENGLVVSDQKKSEIDGYIDSLIQEIGEGSRKKFNSMLGEFGINLSMLRTIFINEQKTADLFEYYYGSNGIKSVTDDDREEYLTDNYIHFLQINVNDAYAYDEEDGKYKTDQNGEYIKRSLTDSEKKEKSERISNIDEAISREMDFGEIYKSFSENTDYPGGYYFSQETSANYSQEIFNVAKALEIGEIKKYRSDKLGTFYIKRIELDSGAYKADGNKDFFDKYDTAVAQSLFNKLISDRFEDITTDEELLNQISVKSCKPNYLLR